VTKLEDFHLTGVEAGYAQGLPRKRRRALLAAFRRKSFKEREAVVGRIKAEAAREIAKKVEQARFRHSITGTGEP